MTENPEALVQEITRLNEIISHYTTFFLALDALIFAIMILLVVVGIRFLNSRKKLLDSDEYLAYTIRGQEEERARIARELHDTVAQDLRYCKNLAEKSEAEEFGRIAGLLAKTLKEVRALSYNLAPPDVSRGDLQANVMNLCQKFKEMTGTEIRLTVSENFDSSFLTKDENLNIYRIIQEALNNVQKHARASEVTVLLRSEMSGERKGLYIFVSDDGCGFDAKTILDGMEAGSKDGDFHFGLRGMKKRAELIGAQLKIDSGEGEGSQVEIIKTDTDVQGGV